MIITEDGERITSGRIVMIIFRVSSEGASLGWAVKEDSKGGI